MHDHRPRYTNNGWILQSMGELMRGVGVEQEAKAAPDGTLAGSMGLDMS